MRPYLLAETNWKTVRENHYDLAILPWGATEAHNFHLPYATDVIEADHIAAESARIAWDKGVKLIVLPAIPFGVNTGQSDIKLDININPSTQGAIIRDIVEVLYRQGINRLLILNSHGGNDFKPFIREIGYEYPEIFICTCNWFQIEEASKIFNEAGDHAGEMETSLIMYLRPELVLPLEEAGEGNAKKFRVKALNEKWAWAERKWSQVTNDTGVGNPSAATSEKGEQYFKEVTQKLAEFYVELAGTDINDLYE